MIRLVLFGLIYLCVGNWLWAQQCSPDPGPPIFWEDFGSGPNPGPALPLGTTGFIYGTTQLGGYIISNTSDLKPRIWLGGMDHTEGDTDGYMLILNAHSEGGLFYQRTVTDLCPNTDYVFTYHLANLMEPTSCIGNPVHVQVHVQISDADNGNTLLDTIALRVLVSSRLTWREFNLPLRTGDDQTSLQVKLTNAAQEGCGNDLALDDIGLRYCNVQLEQSVDLCEQAAGRVVVGNSIYTQAGVYLDRLALANSCNDTLVTTTISGETRLLPTLRYTICQGDTLEVANRRIGSSTNFVDTLAGPTPDCPRYQPYEITVQPPQNSIQNITICRGDSLRVGNNWYRRAGIYTDSLTTVAGCDSVVLTNLRIADIEVTIDSAIISIELGQSTQLNARVNLSNTYDLAWQPTVGLSCTDCLDPILEPQSSSTYQLVATDSFTGCQDSASVNVTVLSCEDVFVPNAFSPNADRVNDQLELFTEDCFTRLLSWRIFDRWGGQVYEVTDQTLASNVFTGWNGLDRGEPAAQGVYSYELILERDNGTLKAVRGEVVLVR